MKIAGLVLAGGRSRRFGGREKAMACFAGRPLVAHVATTLARGCAVVAVNAPQTSGAAAWGVGQGLPVIAEDEAHLGPLFGVLAGLRWAWARDYDLLVTAPCDLPHLPCDFVSRLAAAASQGRGAAACDAAGAVQPLCAAWPGSLAGDLEAALAGGHPPARAFVERNGLVPVVFAEPLAFWNINRPTDLRPESRAACAG